MEYKALSAYEKLKLIQDVNFCRHERHSVAIYLNALRKNDRAVIEEYESFGDTPRQIIMNKRDYERHLQFGFTKKEFNQYGWLEKPDFQERERIEFPHKDSWAVGNYITVGKGINDKWSYGMSYSYSTGGAGYGLGVWGELFDNRKECLKSALNELMKGLSKSSGENDRYAKIVLK